MAKLQNINKKLLFGLMVVLCLGMSFTVIVQNVNFMYIVEGGGGGGSPPSAPTLYQPTSPDYDGRITLQWSSVSSATSYKVYRCTSQYGTYSLIATTSSTTYTDIRDPGTWWYKIKACNSYGSSSYSNARSVVVIIKGIQWYNFPSFPLYPNDWSPDYINWMEDWRITKTAQGIYPGNNLVVCMQPMSYVQNYYTYTLEYALNMHVTTMTGDNDGWPQPTMDDFYGIYFYPAPMAVQQVKVTNRLLGGQPSQNSLSYIDACSNTLLGVYTSTNQEMENWVWNGDFNALGLCWEKYGTEHGSIGFDYNYGRNQYGMRIINNDGASIGAYNTNLDISSIYGSDNLYIKYWGKRISSDPDTAVGIDIKVTYTDGTYAWLFPTELRMTYTDGWWHFYEYSFEAPKPIASIQPYALNYAIGTAYFDQIYITNEGWALDKRGNWEQGNYQNTYNLWWQEMQSIQAFNNGLGVVGKAVEIAGLLSSLIPPPYGTAIGILCGVGGFFIDALKITSSPFGTWNHKNGHTVDGEWGWVLACDDAAAMHYDLTRSDLDYVRTRTLEIKVEVWWSYVGISDWLNICPGEDCSDYATVTFQVDCSNIHWCP